MFYPYGEQLKERGYLRHILATNRYSPKCSLYTDSNSNSQFRSLSLMFAAFSISTDRRTAFLKESVSWYNQPGHRPFLKHFAPGNEGSVICLFRRNAIDWRRRTTDHILFRVRNSRMKCKSGEKSNNEWETVRYNVHLVFVLVYQPASSVQNQPRRKKERKSMLTLLLC